jgi:hypothetical protein
LRHCHATLLDAVGAPLGTVQALLGHASPEVTRQIYLHAIPEEQRRAVEEIEKLLTDPNEPKFREPGKGQISKALNLQVMLVDVAGLEPATPCLQSRCSPN